MKTRKKFLFILTILTLASLPNHETKALSKKSAKALYPWETRDSWPECRDLVLMYGGGSHRNYQWDANRVKPYVTYIDEQGQEHWMFDSYLFLEIKDGNGVSFATGYTPNPATQADWKRLVNYFFQKNYTAGALETAIGNATKRIGQPLTKHKLVIGIPEPIKTLTNWGTVEDGRVLNFNVNQDRIDAVKWYIDYVREKFNEGNYQHLELAGFYWIAEEASNSKTISAPVAEYLNDYKYSFTWIPYFNSPGWKDWAQWKFNYAYLQPNYFFKEPLIADRLDAACQNAISENMDMELEFDERILTKNSAWHYRLENYIDAFERYGIWQTKRIAYYQGSRALSELAISTDSADKAIYHRFCKKVAERTNVKNISQNWSFSNANTPANPLVLPGTQIDMFSVVNSSTRNMAVGKMNNQDRVFIFTRVGDGQAKVLMYNADNGSFIDSLRTGGVIAQTNNGNLVAIGGGGLTDDGKLLLSNVVGPKANADPHHFKVYMWSNVSQTQPEVVVDYYTKTSYPLGRYGDKIFISGSYDDGTARIYATNKIAGYAKVLYWSMKPNPLQNGGFVFDDSPNELFEVHGKNIQSSITRSNTGEYYYKESERQIVKFNVSGDSIAVSSSDVVRGWGTSVQYITKDGDDDIIAYFKYRSKEVSPIEAQQEKADILRLPNGSLKDAVIIASTPSLGANYNLNGWGDVFARRQNDKLEIFVLSATNGIGKYTVTDIFKSPPSSDPVSYIQTTIYRENGNIVLDGVTPLRLNLYNLSGQLVVSGQNTNRLETDKLCGVYILQIITKSNQVENIKILL